jgi:hypothetical protein
MRVHLPSVIRAGMGRFQDVYPSGCPVELSVAFQVVRFL